MPHPPAPAAAEGTTNGHLPVAPRTPPPCLEEDYTSRRSPQVLFKLLKDLLKSQYQAVENEFCLLDEMNTGRLSQELMYQLLKK